MSKAYYRQLLEDAQQVLHHNDQGGYTAPSISLYPHQWLWDSCFTAIGLRHQWPNRAVTELRSLFAGQWENGMLPHIIFSDEGKYRIERNFWSSQKAKGTPTDRVTSGISQPPIAAIAASELCNSLPAAKAREIAQEFLPKLIRYHQWWYRERQPSNDGLVVIIHPWESGLDNNPAWMQPLIQSRLPLTNRLLLRLPLDRLAHVLRRDLRDTDAAQRSNSSFGLRSFLLINQYKAQGFDSLSILKDPTFAVYSVLINSLLIQSNQALLDIADYAGKKLPHTLQSQMIKTTAGMERLWHPDDERYYDYDLVARRHIPIPTVSMFLPLACNCLAPARAEHLLSLLHDPARFWPKFPVPSVATDSSYFDPQRFWLGPTWVNTNWLLIRSLRRYGRGDLAEVLSERTLAMVGNAGFYEYYHPHKGKGLGAQGFSWTAALVADLIETSRHP